MHGHSSRSNAYEGCRREVFELMQGHFNNRVQAEIDAHKGMETARKGGHEFISVLIEPYFCPNDLINGYDSERLILIARYFFGTDTSNTFRCRLYEFPEDIRKDVDLELPEKNDIVYMKIHKPNDEAEEKLKANAYDLKRYSPSVDYDCKHLPECNLCWEPRNRLERIIRGKGFRGKLVNGQGVEISSQRDPNVTLVVYDDLQITKKNLFINDRIYSKKTGELIIGNTKNIPYKLCRM